MSYRIPYPAELKVNNSIYNLKGIVVHMGQGLAYGHYWALAKCLGKWIEFDDTKVKVVEDKHIQIYYGAPPCGSRYSNVSM